MPTCPTCRTALTSTRHEGHELSGCTTCAGRFISYEALRATTADAARPRPHSEHVAAMEGSATAATAGADERPPLPCPECGTEMRRYVHQYASGVWVDSCEVHGVWLDAGELERLEAYAEAQAAGLMPSRADQVGTPGVGTSQPRVATSEGPWDHLPETGPAQDAGDMVDSVIPVVGEFGVFATLGTFVDGASAWRRLGRRASSKREQELLDQARPDATS